MHIDRDKLIHTTARNLAQAGVVSADEIPYTEEHLSAYTYDELLAALLVSHELMEDTKQPMMVVEVRNICLN